MRAPGVDMDDSKLEILPYQTKGVSIASSSGQFRVAILDSSEQRWGMYVYILGRQHPYEHGPKPSNWRSSGSEVPR